MMRNVICSLAAISTFVAPSLAKADSPVQKPNILVFIADDLGWEEIGAYGHPVIKTPNIDWRKMEYGLITSIWRQVPVVRAAVLFLPECIRVVQVRLICMRICLNT